MDTLKNKTLMAGEFKDGFDIKPFMTDIKIYEGSRIVEAISQESFRFVKEEENGSVRVYLSKEVVQEAKRANKGLTIKMLNRSVGISMTEIGKLSGDKSLEIVLNRLNDVTEYAIALRKSEKYMPDGFGVDFSLKQSGSNVDITASIEMANAPDYSEIVSIVNGNITAINLSAVKSGPVIYLR